VERPLVGELHDVLAEIGLDDLHTGGSSAGFRPISSVTIDLTSHQPDAALPREADDVTARSAASAAKNTRPPTLSTLARTARRSGRDEPASRLAHGDLVEGAGQSGCARAGAIRSCT